MTILSRLAEEAVISRGTLSATCASVHVALLAVKNGRNDSAARILRKVIADIDDRLREIELSDTEARRQSERNFAATMAALSAPISQVEQP